MSNAFASRSSCRLPAVNRIVYGRKHDCACISNHKLFHIVASPASARRRISKLRAATVDEDASPAATDLEFGLACAQGPRDTMEDELCVVPDLKGHLYAAIFDGHGGNAAAVWLHDNLQDFVASALDEEGNVEAALPKAFAQADSELLQYLQTTVGPDGESLKGAGATATVVMASNDKIVTANIGDSAAVLVSNGKGHVLTAAHRVHGEGQAVQDEIGRVQSVGGWVSDGRVCDVLAVSRAFGDWEFKGTGLDTLIVDGVREGWWTEEFSKTISFSGDPVIPAPAVASTSISKENGDEFLVMATDGLWDFYKQNAAVQQARSSMQQGASAQDVADQLVDLALKRYTSDNVAVIVMKMPWGLVSPSQPASGNRSRSKMFGLF